MKNKTIYIVSVDRSLLGDEDGERRAPVRFYDPVFSVENADALVKQAAAEYVAFAEGGFKIYVTISRYDLVETESQLIRKEQKS